MAARRGAGAPPVGRGVRQDRHGKAQVIRATGRWSQEAEARFLGELAATANVRAAAAAAGFLTTAIRKERAAWPGSGRRGLRRSAWPVRVPDAASMLL